MTHKTRPHPHRPTSITVPPPPPVPPPPSPASTIIRPRFAASSFWYQPLPADVPLHPDNATFVQTLLGQLGTGTQGKIGTNIYEFTMPLYNPASSDNVQVVTALPYQSYGVLPDLQDQWNAVRLPSYSAPSEPPPAQDGDAEMGSYDPVQDSYFESFGTQPQVGGGWGAYRGGLITGCKTSDGIWSHPFGGAATGLPYTAGQINADELNAGVIEHVIGFTIGNAEASNIFSWPANRSDGWNPNNLPNQIPEGLRFRLAPTVDISGLAPLCKIIAKAAQTYGFVITDKSGGIPSIRFENALTWTQMGQPDPYVALLNGMQPYNVMDGFPIESIQFLPMNYGQPA